MVINHLLTGMNLQVRTCSCVSARVTTFHWAHSVFSEMEEFHILSCFSQKPMIKIMTGIQQKVMYPPYMPKWMSLYIYMPHSIHVWNIYLHENHKNSAVHVGKKPGVRTDASWWVATLIGAALCLLAKRTLPSRNFTVEFFRAKDWCIGTVCKGSPGIFSSGYLKICSHGNPYPIPVGTYLSPFPSRF